MPIGKFFYVTRKTEDGSIGVDFYTDKEAAQIACDIEEKAGRALPKNRPQGIELEFDNNGTLVTPDATTAELRQRLIETAMTPPPAAVEEEEDIPTVAAPPLAVADPFSRAARQATAASVPAKPVNDPLAGITSVQGKVVAFAGKFSSISRPRMKEYAATLGVRVASSVTEDTDILVVGDGAGLKLERAQEHGALIITENQWLELAQRMQTRQPKPAFGM